MNLVGEKGMNTLLRISLEKERKELYDQLYEMKKSGIAVLVHHNCRRKFIDPRKKDCTEEAPAAKRLRSSTSNLFDWKTCCFLCEKKVELRHKFRDSRREVQTLPLHGIVIDCAKQRNDDWGKKVLARMENCIDLVAAEAVYHSKCMAEFRLNQSDVRKVRGRPSDSGMTEAFERICDWLENSMDCELYSIQELHQKMLEKNNGHGYSIKSFREKLKSRYQEHVYFVQGVGRNRELVCFKDMADYILRDMKENGKTKGSVITAAAKLIKADIREMEFATGLYPNEQDIFSLEEGSKWVPESLTNFLKQLITSNLKRLSISQCIIQASRPRTVIAPIPFGIGVELAKALALNGW